MHDVYSTSKLISKFTLNGVMNSGRRRARMYVATVPSIWILVGLLLSLFISGCERAQPTASREEKAERVHLVEVVPVVNRSLSHTSVRTGTLQVRQEVKLFNQEEGRVAQLAVYVGDAVEQGQVLVRLDDTLIRVDLNKTVANRNQAQANLKRVQSLKKKQLVSEDELSRVETLMRVAEADEQSLRTRLDFTTLHAPFDGVVSQRHVEPGDAIPRFTHVLSLIDMTSLYTSVSVSELLLPSLGIGQPVTVQIDALGDVKFDGEIERIHPTIDTRTRQGTVEVALKSTLDGAIPGQLCRVTLHSSVLSRLVVPFSSLRRDNEGEYVIVVEGKEIAKRRRVRSGLRLASQAEILEGLTEGEQVVVRGFLGLRDDLPVTIVDSNGIDNKQQAN